MRGEGNDKAEAITLIGRFSYNPPICFTPIVSFLSFANIRSLKTTDQPDFPIPETGGPGPHASKTIVPQHRQEEISKKFTMAEDTRAASSCRFSTRISLRWLPEPAHETTDTIVMSVKDWYLDLRMDKQTQKIDWAIAGQRIVESQEPRTFTPSILSPN